MDIQLKRKVRSDFYKWKKTVNEFNRFDIRNPFLSMLEDNRRLFSCRIDKDSSFFRGRIFNLDEVVSNENEFIKFIESKKVS